jgi:glycosyltransferase involved in cell wall biosynthesis
MGKTIAVMPALNAETTLEQTVADIPDGAVDEIILVDDASSDRTVELAQSLGLTVFRHERTCGYGANQKTCYRQALERGADVILMIHPDYQYDSSLAPYMINFIQDNRFDIMLGSRIRTRAESLAGGMPPYKYFSNRFLTIVENVLMGQNLSEYHTGYRAYSRRVLETIPWETNSDDFVFDTQFLVQSIHFGFKIAEIPVPVRYMQEASSINFSRSMTYGLLTLVQVLKFVAQNWGLAQYRMFQPKLPPNGS